MWNRKPKYDHLRVFGSVGFARKNKPRFGKFEDRSEKVVLLGYATNSKEYLVKEFNTNRVMKVRTAQFNEEVKYRKPKTKNYPKETSVDELKDYWLDVDYDFSQKGSKYEKSNKPTLQYDESKKYDNNKEVNEVSADLLQSVPPVYPNDLEAHYNDCFRES